MGILINDNYDVMEMAPDRTCFDNPIVGRSCNSRGGSLRLSQF